MRGHSRSSGRSTFCWAGFRSRQCTPCSGAATEVWAWLDGTPTSAASTTKAPDSIRMAAAPRRERCAVGGAVTGVMGTPGSLVGRLQKLGEARIAVGLRREVVGEQRCIDLGRDRDLRVVLPALDQYKPCSERDG